RDEADEEGVERLQDGSAGRHGGGHGARRSAPRRRAAAPGPGIDPSGHPRRGTDDRLASHAIEGPAERLHVPAIARGEENDPRSRCHASIPNDRSSIASSVPPAEKTRPVDVFVTVTCAGLKSSGSIA